MTRSSKYLLNSPACVGCYTEPSYSGCERSSIVGRERAGVCAFDRGGEKSLEFGICKYRNPQVTMNFSARVCYSWHRLNIIFSDFLATSQRFYSTVLSTERSERTGKGYDSFQIPRTNVGAHHDVIIQM